MPIRRPEGTYGLSGSGVDVDALVKKMMKGPQIKADRLFQAKTLVQWKKTAYNDVYKSMTDFRNTVFKYKLNSTLAAKGVSSSNESIASATAGSDAANFNHSLMINELASAVSITSADKLASGENKTNLATQFGLPADTDMKMQISDGASTKTISFNTSQSIYELTSVINQSGLKVKANYDANLDRFFMYGTETGSGAKVEFKTEAGGSDQSALDFFQDKLKIDVNANYTGKDASFVLDGVNYTQSKNNFTIAGVNYSLKGKGAADINITPDNSKTVAAVKSFVEEYNKLIEKVGTLLDEKRYRDFPPLTDAQRADLKEDQIKKWDEKAKSGMLMNDTILSGALSGMRSIIMENVAGLEGKYRNLSSIGIESSPNWKENGKLYVDEDKLNKALQEDPDLINKMFASKGEFGKTGIADKLYDSLKGAMDRISTKGGASASIEGDTKSELGRQIRDYNLRIDDMGKRMIRMETMYYKRFNAMEKALAQLGKQSAWLAQKQQG